MVIFLSFSFGGHSQLTDPQVRDLKAGKVKPDTSYVYDLPFAGEKSFLLIQAYNSKMSHAKELSLDFKMKPGSKICAARPGVVLAIKADSDKGGLQDQYLHEGNHIIIKHEDGSKAMYWHLQKDGVAVNLNDSVKKGQWIVVTPGILHFPICISRYRIKMAVI
jgi:murein DD-endopeptidase MepM/ murein hydrolase activator NlpD